MSLTLLTVNWNQQPCVELLLKSHVKHNYAGEPIKICLVDNGSTDGSKEWLKENEIPFVDLYHNVGHENGINLVFKSITTKYVLLLDTDVEFYEDISDYLYHLQGQCISAGELIDKNYIGQDKIKDRISPWFWLFDYSKVREAGIDTFRTKEDWSYDVGSEFWERIKGAEFSNYNIERLPGNQDSDIVSMSYPKYGHIGKVSWDLLNHGDRQTEVMRRREYVKKRLKLYEHIELKGKFIQ